MTMTDSPENPTPETYYSCGCGKWTGEPCSWEGPASEMVVVEWMPVYLRVSHEAVGNSGVYPHNGSDRVAVERGCAALLLMDKDEAEWSRIVDVPVTRYTRLHRNQRNDDE